MVKADCQPLFFLAITTPFINATLRLFSGTACNSQICICLQGDLQIAGAVCEQRLNNYHLDLYYIAWIEVWKLS